MGLIQNKTLVNQSPISMKSAGAFASIRTRWGRTEALNIADVLGDLTGFPHGYSVQNSWLPPRKSGGMSSYNSGTITFTPSSLNVAQGRNIDGVTSFNITGQPSTGAAIASAIGTTSFTFTTAGTAVAPINGIGTSSITFTAANANIQATADIVGITAFAFTGNALPTYANGFMIAVPIDTALTPDSVASAVWSANAASNNTAGSMGEKLNDAGAAGNPWAVLLAANNDPATFGKLVQDIQTLVDELHKIQGLDAANPMTVTPSSRVSGDISLTLTGDGETTTTVTRD